MRAVALNNLHAWVGTCCAVVDVPALDPLAIHTPLAGVGRGLIGYVVAIAGAQGVQIGWIAGLLAGHAVVAGRSIRIAQAGTSTVGDLCYTRARALLKDAARTAVLVRGAQNACASAIACSRAARTECCVVAIFGPARVVCRASLVLTFVGQGDRAAIAITAAVRACNARCRTRAGIKTGGAWIGAGIRGALPDRIGRGVGAFAVGTASRFEDRKRRGHAEDASVSYYGGRESRFRQRVLASERQVGRVQDEDIVAVISQVDIAVIEREQTLQISARVRITRERIPGLVDEQRAVFKDEPTGITSPTVV